MKLTLRELFLAVALVAMACGWWVQHRVSEARRDAIVKEYVNMYKTAYLIQSHSTPGVASIWQLDFENFPIGKQLVHDAGGLVPADTAIPLP